MDIVGRLTTALVDRYRIERELGAGGMATVYLAHDVRHDRKVALKVLRPELAAILGAERFLHEIRTTANLQHPHILPLHDSGEVDGVVYYVMPYVEGESLRDRLMREKQLPVDDAVRVAREVADALDYAHRHGIVHRDIKPENILLHDGRVQVADFGIALAVSTAGGGTRMTETGMSLGTPHYMAPEQAMGEREITPKADIYALGCVLYEMLCGEPPFNGPTAQAIIARVMTEEPRSLSIQRHTIPRELEATVRTALEKLPADRFASAAQFADALAGRGPSVPVTRATPAAAPVRARRAALAAVPWVLLLAASGAGAWGWMREAPPPLVRRQRLVLRDNPFNPGGVGRNVALSPDGLTVVFVDTVGGARQLWAKEHDRLEPTLLTGTTGAWGPVFSPDGAWIAFVADNRIKKIPRQGGSSIAVADSGNVPFSAIAWLDNDSIAYADSRFNLRLVHQDGGPARLLQSVDSTSLGVVTATPLPQGRGLITGNCVAGCSSIELRVVDLRTGALRTLAEEVVKGWYTSNGTVVFVRQDGGVFSAPFDLDKLEFRSAPVPVLDGIRTVPGRADMVLGADGTLLYVPGGTMTGGALAAMMSVSRDGVAVPFDTAWSFQIPGNFGWALSPDGRRVAIAVRGAGSDDIWVKELDRGPFTRLTFGGTNMRPEWTADGRSVMYVARSVTGTTREDVVARRADGTGTADTLVKRAIGAFEIRRTRDTATLFIRTTTGGGRDIQLLRRGIDTVPRPLVAAPGFDEVAPALSPDGRWLAYSSNESGRHEIYVRPFPSVDAGRWQVSRNGGGEPRWAHSGRELLYREAGGNLVSVAVESGAAFRAGAQRTLFNAGAYQSNATTPLWNLMPDDRRFVFVRDLQGGLNTAEPTFIVQVDHWLAELAAAGSRR